MSEMTQRTTAPISTVWGVLADIRAWPTWLPTVDTVEVQPGQTDVGPGSRYLLKQPRLPRATWVITEWRPEAGFTWESHAAGVRTTGTHALRPLPDGGAEVTLGISWAGPLTWFARALYGRLTGRYLQTEVRALITTSESRT